MDDLAAFIEARLAEDEAMAKAAEPGIWHARQDDRQSNVEAFDAGEWLLVAGIASDEETAAHIARHDPARVLREVTAKRAMVRLCARVIEDDEGPDGTARGWSDGWSGLSVAREALRQLAAPYSDHPDYRAEWAPAL